MAFVNTYAPPHDVAVGDPYGPDPWDLNFMFFVPPAIENDVVRLTPFIPRLHADGFWDVAGASDPELYRFIRRSFASKDEFMEWTRIGQKNPEFCTFLVVDKTKPANEAEGRNLGGAMAGMMSYMTTSKANRVRSPPFFASPHPFDQVDSAVYRDWHDRDLKVRSAHPRHFERCRAAHEVRSQSALGPDVPRSRPAPRPVDVRLGQQAVTCDREAARLPVRGHPALAVDPFGGQFVWREGA
jgi:hypothetical protein